MNFRTSTARCCCQCEDCCGGTAPAEFEVDFTFTDDGCSRCDDYLSSTFTLARVGDSCRWRFQQYLFAPDESDCNDPVDPYGSTDLSITGLLVELSIFCTSATEYTITLTMVQLFYFNGNADIPGACDAFGGPIDTVGAVRNIYTWQKVVTAAGFDCTTANETLTYQGRRCECARTVTDIVGASFDCDTYGDANWWGCDEPGDVDAVAV